MPVAYTGPWKTATGLNLGFFHRGQTKGASRARGPENFVFNQAIFVVF